MEWKFEGAYESGFSISQHLPHNTKIHIVESLNHVISEAFIERLGPRVSLVHTQLDTAYEIPILAFNLVQNFSSNPFTFEFYIETFSPLPISALARPPPRDQLPSAPPLS